MDIKHKSRAGGLSMNAKAIKSVWSCLLCVMIFSSCSNNYGLNMGCFSSKRFEGELSTSLDRKDKRIVLVCDDVFPEDFRSLSEHQSALQEDGQKEIIFHYVKTVNSEQDYYAALTSMHDRAELFIKSVRRAIEENRWDQQQDDFIVIGHMEEGLSVLEAAETLKEEIDIKHLIIVGAPLNGYNFFETSYAENRGAIGLMLKGMRKAILVRNSTIIQELTPHSEYLRQRRAFIESQTEEDDLKIHIMDASSKKICLKVEEEGVDAWKNIEINYELENSIVYKEELDKAVEQVRDHAIANFREMYPEEQVDNLEQLDAKVERYVRRVYNRGIKKELNQAYQSKCKRDLDKLYLEVAQRIRKAYQRASDTGNIDELPGVEEFKTLRSFIENKGKAGYYLFFEKLNGGEEHDGFLSVSTQRGGNITNPRVTSSSFDGYAGTLSIPYKELRRLGPLNLFNQEDYIFSNKALQEEIFRWILDT